MDRKKNNNINSRYPLVSKENSLIDKSVKFINEKANETLYKGSIEIGDYILKHFFNNNLEAASSKNPHKPKSYKKLCQRDDLIVPYSTLTVMVRVAAQERFFKAQKINLDKLTYTHKSEFIRLENSDGKLDLVKKCINENLSTRQLTSLINISKKKLLEDDRQTPTILANKNLLNIERILTSSQKSELVTDINKLRGMRSKTRKNLQKKASDMLAQVSSINKECKKLLKSMERLDKEDEIFKNQSK